MLPRMLFNLCGNVLMGVSEMILVVAHFPIIIGRNLVMTNSVLSVSASCASIIPHLHGNVQYKQLYSVLNYRRHEIPCVPMGDAYSATTRLQSTSKQT